MNLIDLMLSQEEIKAGGPGSGRKPYGKSDHDAFKKQVNAWKKEVANRRDMSPDRKRDAVINKVMPYGKGQDGLDHAKEMAKQEKDATARSFLEHMISHISDEKGNFDEYGSKSVAHRALKNAESNSPGITHKLAPNLVHWIKSAPAAKGDSGGDVGGDDDEED